MKLIEFIHALLYIGTEQVRSWIHHPLWQASQCLLLLSRKELQKGGSAKDLPGGCLRRICQVVCQWGYGRGVGCLCRRGVRQSLCYPRDKRYAVWPG